MFFQAIRELGSLRKLAAVLSLIVCSSFGSPVHAAPRVFNVKSYGATGNGITNDYAAILKAVELANSEPGSIVFFPTGRYLCGAASPLVPLSITLEGSGATRNRTSTTLPSIY